MKQHLFANRHLSKWWSHPFIEAVSNRIRQLTMSTMGHFGHQLWWTIVSNHHAPSKRSMNVTVLANYLIIHFSLQQNWDISVAQAWYRTRSLGWGWEIFPFLLLYTQKNHWLIFLYGNIFHYLTRARQIDDGNEGDTNSGALSSHRLVSVAPETAPKAARQSATRLQDLRHFVIVQHLKSKATLLLISLNNTPNSARS